MAFSFIHTADIHLGRPFSDLFILNDKMEICNQACNKSFNKIVDTAIEKHVDFVLVAGDSFDSEEHDLSSKLLFINNLKKLADNGIKSYVICGNHDPIELYKKYRNYFKFNDNYNEMISIVGVNTEKNIGVFRYNDEVVINAISFETESASNPTELLKKLGKDDNVFNIGLIHCDLDKTESKYAPCSREDLKSLDYDYYALGHIHIPDYKEKNIVYAGSPQGRTRKETDAHGFYYVQVDNKKIINKEFIESDIVRFLKVDVDCSNIENLADVFDEIISVVNSNYQNVEMNLFEVTLTGITKVYEDLIKQEDLLSEFIKSCSDNERNNVAVYSIVNGTKPNVDIDELMEDKGVIGIITKSFLEKSAIDMEQVYDEIVGLHESIYKNLNLEPDVKKELIENLVDNKENLLEMASNEAITMCKEIYNLEV